MNRYTLSGIVDDARKGRNVVVLAASAVRVPRLVTETAALAGPDLRVINRTLGRERIQLISPGSIRFLSSAQALARLSKIDVVVIDSVTHTAPEDGAILHAARSATHGGSPGEVIEA